MVGVVVMTLSCCHCGPAFPALAKYATRRKDEGTWWWYIWLLMQHLERSRTEIKDKLRHSPYTQVHDVRVERRSWTGSQGLHKRWTLIKGNKQFLPDDGKVLRQPIVTAFCEKTAAHDDPPRLMVLTAPADFLWNKYSEIFKLAK